MAIFRGTGGSGESTTNTIANEVAANSVAAQAAATAAAASATTAGTQASNASSSASAAASSASTASSAASTATAAKNAAEAAQVAAEEAEANAIAAAEGSVNFAENLDISVTTLAAGEEATVDYDSEAFTLAFSIPRGDTGATGATGPQGPQGDPGEVTLAGTQTLTNKTLAFASNTLTGVAGVTATQTLTNKTVEKLVLNDGYTEEVFAITDGATVNLDPNNGSIQTWTLGANRTPGQANWAAGQSITLMIDDGTAQTITWTTLAPVWETNGGSAPTLALTGFTVIVLWKVGTTIYGARVGDA
jgi:hypothetical protein